MGRDADQWCGEWRSKCCPERCDNCRYWRRLLLNPDGEGHCAKKLRTTMPGGRCFDWMARDGGET